ncbi:MAG: hypothetical protein AAFV53_11195 [Myxococcota bacterium]
MSFFFVLASSIFACNPLIDLNDCGYFGEDDCEWYTPAGTACGLAAEDDAHYGGSCALNYDPALTFTEGALPQVAIDRKISQRCPDQFSDDGLLDEDIDGYWWSCFAEGNAERSSAELREVPAQTVCGLSKPRTGQGARCEDRDPRIGDCPDGYDFRWVIERGSLEEDGQCQSTREGSGFNPVARLITFCAVQTAAGCTDNCPDNRKNDGWLCGLHVRDLTGSFPLALEDLTVINQPDSGPETMLDYLRRCAPHQEYITSDLIDAVERNAAANARPMCRGEEIVGDTCPGELQLICTSDDQSPEDNNLIFPTLCWCDNPDSAQDNGLEVFR